MSDAASLSFSHALRPPSQQHWTTDKSHHASFLVAVDTVSLLVIHTSVESEKRLLCAQRFSHLARTSPSFTTSDSSTLLALSSVFDSQQKVLRHLLGNNLINSMLKHFDLLWKPIPKEKLFPTSSSCTQDDGEPQKVLRHLLGRMSLLSSCFL
jgi:hypothetical protein